MDHAGFRWRDIIIPAFGPSILFGIGKGAVLPIIALTAIDLNASHAVSGLIVALIGLGSLVSNIPAALITARFGERRSLIGASMLTILALAICLLAHKPLWLAAGVLMLGMASSVFYLARQSYMIDAVPMRMRARAFSMLGGVERIGMLVGPFAAAGFMHYMGLPGAYWMAIIMLCATLALTITLPELRAPGDTGNAGTTPAASQTDADDAAAGKATTQARAAVADTVKKPRMWSIARQHARTFMTLGSGVILIGALRASRQVAIPLWAEHIGLSPATTAVVFGLVSVIDVLVFYPAGKIMDEFGRIWVALPCTVLLGASFMAIPLTTSLLPFVLVCMVMGLGNGFGAGIVMTLGADAAPEQGRTQFLGLWRLIADTGTSSGPFFLSGMTALISLGAGVMAVGSFGFIAAAIFWRYLPHTRPGATPR